MLSKAQRKALDGLYEYIVRLEDILDELGEVHGQFYISDEEKLAISQFTKVLK